MGHEHRHPGLVPGLPRRGGRIILGIVELLRARIAGTGVCGLSGHQAHLLHKRFARSYALLVSVSQGCDGESCERLAAAASAQVPEAM